MGKRGPARTPEAIVALRGKPSHHSRPPGITLGSDVPLCPPWLDKEAKREWCRLTNALADAHLLSVVDRAALTAHCEAWAEFVFCVKELRRLGLTFTTDNGYVCQHALVGVKNKAVERMNRFIQQFGLSPSARASIPAGNQQSDVDPITSILSERYGSAN